MSQPLQQQSMHINTKDYKTFWTTDGREIPLSQTDRVLPNDTVQYNGEKYVTTERADHPLLVGVLNVKSKYMYGMSSRGTPQYLFTPYNESYPPFIVGSKDKTANKIVLIKFESWDVGQKFPKGQLVNTIGLCGDFLAEAKALYWQHSPYMFKGDAYDSASEDQLLQEGRTDLTDKYTLNIDPAGCKDIDDVLTVYEIKPSTSTNTSTSEYCIGITISDVSETIDPGSQLDIHAARTGQSLYSEFLPPRNMLPPIFSEDHLSLLPGKKRLGISLICRFIDNTFIESLFVETVVKNKESFTYENVAEKCDPKVVNMIRRAARALGITEANAQDPHKWIETFMIFYNTEVAKVLQRQKVGIFRGQKAAVANDMEKYKRICPELANQAAVFTDCENILPHMSLGLDYYCYATSPIRRYVDIVNQRLLKFFIKMDFKNIILEEASDIQPLVDQQNLLQKGAKHHSREDFFLRLLQEGEHNANTNNNNKTSRTIEGVVFDFNEAKMKVYVPLWKRFVKVRHNLHEVQEKYEEGQTIQLRYFYDANQVAWKNRMVFEVMPTTI